jgi:hypothetical protein
MVLVLSRGGFCPKDRRQAAGLVELHPDSIRMAKRMSKLSANRIRNGTRSRVFHSCFEGRLSFPLRGGTPSPPPRIESWPEVSAFMTNAVT